MGLPHLPISLLVLTCIAALAITLTGSMSVALKGVVSSIPEKSLAVSKFGRCFGRGPQDFSCLSVVNVTTPKAKPGRVLIKTSGGSLNPDELVSLGNTLGSDYTPGWDVSGVVVAVGYGVKELKVGDRVWSMYASGGMAEYTNRYAHLTAKVPDGLDLTAMGTLPTVAMTSLGALEAAGAPWPADNNISVLVTGGTGGTGYTAVQLAKCMGAARVIAGAGPDNIDFVKSLGVDVVVDYHKQSVFDMVADGSIDVVLDNHVTNGTVNADRAMAKLRRGGVYVTINPTDLAENPPFGITQVRYSVWPEIGDWTRKLDLISSFISAGKMRIDIQDTFAFDHIRDVFAMIQDGHVRSKISVVARLSNLFAFDRNTVAV